MNHTWTEVNLEDVCVPGGLVRGPFGGSLKKSDFVRSGYQVYEQRHAIGGTVEGARYFISPKKFAEMRRFAVEPGDFIVSCSGTIGRLFRIPEDAPPGVINQALLKLTVNTDVIDPRFFSMYFSWDKFQNLILDNTQGGAMQNLVGMPIFKKSPFRLPGLAEQRLIADKFASVDELITSLEQLIVKKQALKQGMMQQLLTGKTRLPGFTESWKMRKIGQFAQVKAGGTPATSVPRYWGGSIRWMSSGEIHQKRVYDVRGRITEDGLRESSAQVFQPGTVLMALAGQGKTRGTVAVSRVELATNQSIAGIFPSIEHDPDFLYYNLDTRYAELRGESAGDGGRGGLNLTIIKNLDVLMPEVGEQKAIARALAEVDKEIIALTRRSIKVRAIKQGMMQELLTGRTRLRPAETIA